MIKKKGIKYPDVAEIRNCCESNPDGFALAWNEGGELKTFKTMDEDVIIKKYEELRRRLSCKSTAVVFHARIATHGSIGIRNCHCWTGSGYAFAHNGVLSNVQNRGDLTDSETFFRDIFEPVYGRCGWTVAERVIDAVKGTSKFAFLDKDGNVRSYGHYEKHNGALYSNSSYRRWTVKHWSYPSYFDMNNELDWSGYGDERLY